MQTDKDRDPSIKGLAVLATQSPAAAMVEYRDTLKAYLHQKTLAEDWHGVSDAANDLREQEAKMRALGVGW